MKNRGDFVAFFEPFARSAYYSEERIFTLEEEVQLNPEYNYQVVLEELVSTAKKSQVFVKDFPRHFFHRADKQFLSFFQHTFLIRDPAQMLPSYLHKWPNLTFEETGYRQLYELFDKVASYVGQIPPLIDADDLVNQPESTVRAYCNSVGILFIPDALRWEPPQEKVKKMSWWDGGSWHDSMSVTRTFCEQVNSHYLTIDESDRLKSYYELCLPYYEKLHSYRLRVDA